jgi:hypothetical protein
MAKLTITQASQQFSVGRSTLYRSIQSGRITVHHENGVKYIDSSEMVRVYRPRETSGTVPVVHRGTPSGQSGIDTNERAGIYLIAARNEIKILREQNALLTDQINRKDNMLDMLTRRLPKPKDD